MRTAVLLITIFPTQVLRIAYGGHSIDICSVTACILFMNLQKLYRTGRLFDIIQSLKCKVYPFWCFSGLWPVLRVGSVVSYALLSVTSPDTL